MKNIEVSQAENDKQIKKMRRTFWLILIPILLTILPLTFIAATYLTDEDLTYVLTANLLPPEVRGVQFETYTYGYTDEVSASIQDEIDGSLSDVSLDGVKRFTKVDEEPQVLFTSQDTEPESLTIPLINQNFLPVVEYYSLTESLTVSDLSSLDYYVLEEQLDEAESVLKSVVDGQLKITAVDDIEAMIDSLETTDGSIGLLSPDKLDPRLKLIAYEGAYFLDSPTKGFLASTLYAISNASGTEYILTTLPNHFIAKEASHEKLTPDQIFKLRMTGVTAISRNLAININKSGDPGYGADLIGEFLSDADLTHTSNEVSFVPGCVPEQSLRFCANIAHFETLKKSGIDIIELTGNHNNDYGAKYNAETIELYTKEGIMHFGGGVNEDDADDILYLEKDGTKVAMIGYNWFDSMLNTQAIAGPDRPGANRFSSENLKSDIAEAKENAELVIVDFQFEECYSYPENPGVYPYCYKPLSSPDQKGVFREAVDLGADIVVGTQAHQPQTFEIYKDKLIFYGLGNLYFDQISWLGTRQGLILTHYFIDNVHVQTKIDTTIYDRDMKPYLTNGSDREYLLQLLNEAR